MSRVQTITVRELTSANPGLPFAAQSVMVHNLTASWLLVTDGNIPVPPFQYGACIPFNAANPQPRITWVTPTGVSAPTPGSGTATLIFTEDLLPPSAGQPVVTPSQQVQCKLTVQAPFAKQLSATSFQTVAVGSGQTAFVTVNVPAGANSVTIVGQFANLTQSVQLQGMQTLTQYMAVTAPVNSNVIITPPLFAIIETGSDNQLALQIVLSAGAAASGPISVVANFGTQVVAVENTGTPLQMVGVVGGQTVNTQISPIGSPFIAISGLNAATSLFLPSPGVGVFNRISSLIVTWSGSTAGAPAITIKDSTTTVIWEAVIGCTAPGQPPPFNFPVPLSTITGDGSMSIGVTAAGAAGIASILSGTFSIY